MNFFQLVIESDSARFTDINVSCKIADIARCLSSDLRLGSQPTSGRYILGVRPEGLVLANPDQKSQFSIRGTVAFVESLGSDTYLHLNLDRKGIICRAPSTKIDYKVGQTLELGFGADSIHLFSAEKETRTFTKTLA